MPEGASPNAVRYAQECEGGVMTSCHALGLLYRMGEESGHGVPRDEVEAERWLRVACEGGVVEACEGSGEVTP